MRPATAAHIERHLYEAGGWLSAQHLMDYWDLPERGIRRRLAGVVVACERRGYIHVAHATREDLEAYCGPKKGHAVTELKNIKLLRDNFRHGRVPPPYEDEAAPERPAEGMLL